MGDERSPETEPTTTTTASDRTGRDPNPAGSAPSRAEIIGGSDDGQEAAGGIRQRRAQRDGSSEDGAGLSPRTEADVAAAAATSEAEPESTDGEDVRGPEGELNLNEIEGHALRAIRYHEARAQFLDFWRRFFDFLVILLGAGAVTTATGEHTTAGAIVGLLLAGIGALQLVAGFSEKSGEHASLKRRFCAVLADIVEARSDGPLTAKRLSKTTRKWTAIWSDEPPTYHVLEAIAWNAARRSREYNLDESTLIEISRWQSLTRNILTWEGFEPLTRAERAARRGTNTDGSTSWWQREQR